MQMLETGNYAQAAHANGKEGTMTAIEYKTEFSMWAIAASPLVVTTPIMNCTSPPAPPVTSCKVQLVTKVRILIYLSSLTACDSKGREE
jgi:hypothetical protein